MSLDRRELNFEMASLASTSPRCELCPARPLVWCEADQAFLCGDCDDRVHSANFIVFRHTRSALCRSCFKETGLSLQGTRHPLFLCHTSLPPAPQVFVLPAMVPVLQPLGMSFCATCPKEAVFSPPLQHQVGGVEHTTTGSMISNPLPLEGPSTSRAAPNPYPTLSTFSLEAAQKRRRLQDQLSRDPCAEVTLRLDTGTCDRHLGGSHHVKPSKHLKPTEKAVQWLRMSLDPEADLLDSGRSTPMLPGWSHTERSLQYHSCSSSPKHDKKCVREVQSGCASSMTTPEQSLHQILVNAAPTSCITPSHPVPPVAGQIKSEAPLHGSEESCTNPLELKQGGKRKACHVDPYRAEELKGGSTDASISSAPLGGHASSRLRRVLKAWSASLGGVNPETQNLAYELFQQALLKMKRGEVAANHLRLTLAACLWLATKLVELRAQVPGLKEVAGVTAVGTKELKDAEITVLKLLDWQPLKHVSDECLGRR